jgi:hypothetical protein
MIPLKSDGFVILSDVISKAVELCKYWNCVGEPEKPLKNDTDTQRSSIVPNLHQKVKMVSYITNWCVQNIYIYNISKLDPHNRFELHGVLRVS